MAIAFDSATNPALANSTSLTFAHTCSGSDRILFVGTMVRTTTISGVTYNGVSMTAIGTRELVSGADYIQWFYLIAPATGANNVVISLNASNIIIGGAVSYTGAKQTSQPDAVTNNPATTESTTTTSVTTIADNCWTILLARANDDGNTSASTGSTLRADTAGYIQLYDSNAAKTPAGSTSMVVTQSNQATATQMISIAPVETYGITQSADLESGSSNYFSAVDSTSLSITGNLTIEAWINLESTGDRFIVSKQDSGSDRSYNFTIKSTNYLEAVINQASDGSDQSISTGSTTDFSTLVGTWTHVAMTYTASTGVVRLYVNGVEESYSTQTTNATAINNAGSTLRVGAVSSPESNFMDGKMSLVRIWNEVRTPTQLTDNKCLTLGVTTNLKAEYTLNNTLVDSSGNGNTLTNNNSTVFVSSVPSVCSPASGPANLKSYNGNVIANIKSMNGNLIANVKSFDGNA